jgi:choline dehydrogenase-like flavoprotein
MEVRDMQKYDAIIIGTGQAGPPLAARLVDAGMKVARAKIVRRHLRQHWLHPDENPDRKRLCGEDRTPRH